MEIKIDKKGDVAVLHCNGSLDAETVVVFKKRAAELFDGGVYKFVLDASKLSFIDSMGLGALISLLRRVREKKGDVKAACLNKDLQDIFNITRLDKLFDVYKGVDDAVEKFGV